MARRMISCLVLVGLLLGMTGLVFAGPPWPEPGEWPEYADGDSGQVLGAGAAPQAEEAAWKVHYQQAPAADEAEARVDGPVIQWEDPGVGATQIIINRWSSGYLYEDDAESGTASLIWNIVMNIASYFFGTVGQVILDVAQMLGDTVDTSAWAGAKLFHSYSYPDKLAQVWTERQCWETYFTSSTREWYRHEWATYVTKEGYTHQATRDYTPDRGGTPIRIDYAPHYFDHAWLQNEAWTRWYMHYGPGYERGW